MDKLSKMILRKSIYDVRHLKRYNVTLPKPLSEVFNEPEKKFRFFAKNQVVSKYFLITP
jgi:hypothetical protein